MPQNSTKMKVGNSSFYAENFQRAHILTYEATKEFLFHFYGEPWLRKFRFTSFRVSFLFVKIHFFKSESEQKGNS